MEFGEIVWFIIAVVIVLLILYFIMFYPGRGINEYINQTQNIIGQWP